MLQYTARTVLTHLIVATMHLSLVWRTYRLLMLADKRLLYNRAVCVQPCTNIRSISIYIGEVQIGVLVEYDLSYSRRNIKVYSKVYHDTNGVSISKRR